MLTRRRLLAGACATLAVPLSVEAQQTGRMRVVGFLGAGSARDSGAEAFRRGLRSFGWIEGQTVRIEYRWAEGRLDRFPVLAADLVRLKVDVLVVAGPPAIHAAREATSTIPIVIVFLLDPVAAGYAKSLARPGGNITGLVSQYEDIVPKQVQFLREAIPNLSRLALLHHTSSLAATANASATAATNAGVKVHILEIGDDAGYEAAFRAARDAGAQAVHVLPSPIFAANRQRLIALAARYRLPAAYELRQYVEDGGFLSYGPNTLEMFERVGSYVDRIFKGADPGNLPMERPSKFELVINLKTAKALGLTIPPSLLARADQVIE